MYILSADCDKVNNDHHVNNCTSLKPMIQNVNELSFTLQ